MSVHTARMSPGWQGVASGSLPSGRLLATRRATDADEWVVVTSDGFVDGSYRGVGLVRSAPTLLDLIQGDHRLPPVADPVDRLRRYLALVKACRRPPVGLLREAAGIAEKLAARQVDVDLARTWSRNVEAASCALGRTRNPRPRLRLDGAPSRRYYRLTACKKAWTWRPIARALGGRCNGHDGGGSEDEWVWQSPSRR